MKNNNNKNEKPKNDVIYVRVSSDEQVKGYSLGNQEKFCKEKSKKDGYSLIELFHDDGESAKTTARPGLQKMLRFCEKNKKKISRVVIYKLDRLSRSMQDHIYLEVYLNKLGIELVSATENLQDTSSGKLHKHILAAFSQFDNDVRSERTKAGMTARAEKGLWPSTAPWGYVNTKDKAERKIIAPHPERAPIVKMLFQAYATKKYTFKELAKMANKYGQKSRHGVKISKQLVQKIIKNPIYCGRVVIPKLKVNVEGQHEPIVSKELWGEANSSKSGSIGRKLPRNRDSPRFPLRGILCAGCSKSISGGKTKGKTKYYEYYGCFCAECKARKAIKKDDLEDDFSDFLFKLTPDDEHFDVLKEAIKLAHKSEFNSVASLERKLNLKITEVKDRKDKLLDLMVEGKLHHDDYSPAVEKCKLQITELEKELSELSSPELSVENIIDTGVEFLKTLPQEWKNLDVKDLRVLRNLLFPENLIYHYPTIKTPEVACIYSIKAEFLDTKTRQVN